VGKGKRADVYLEERKGRGHISEGSAKKKKKERERERGGGGSSVPLLRISAFIHSPVKCNKSLYILAVALPF
jgi:hypothetical protein